MSESRPEGYHFITRDALIALRNFDAIQKALYNLADLFITSPLKKEARRPEVRKAVAALAQIAKDQAAP